MSQSRANNSEKSLRYKSLSKKSPDFNFHYLYLRESLRLFCILLRALGRNNTGRDNGYMDPEMFDGLFVVSYILKFYVTRK